MSQTNQKPCLSANGKCLSPEKFTFFLQIFFDDMDIFKDYCVVYERHRTIPQIRIISLGKPEDQYIVQVCVLSSVKL